MKYNSRIGMFALSALLAGCASTSSSDVPTVLPMEGAIVDLSDKLIEAARLRTDLSAMRICVHEIRPELDRADRRLAAISDALEREFVVALSNRINVLDLEAADRRDLGEVSDAHDVSHGLVGSFYERDDELVVTVKLVDARNQLIVAAARGLVPTIGFDVVGETDLRDDLIAVVERTPVAVIEPEPVRDPDPVLPLERQSVPEVAVAEPPPVDGWVTTNGKRKPVAPGAARKPIGSVAPKIVNQEPTAAFTPEDLALSTGPAGRRLRGVTLKATKQ